MKDECNCKKIDSDKISDCFFMKNLMAGILTSNKTENTCRVLFIIAILFISTSVGLWWGFSAVLLSLGIWLIVFAVVISESS